MGIMLNVLFKCWVRFPERTSNYNTLIITWTCHKGMISLRLENVNFIQTLWPCRRHHFGTTERKSPRFCEDKVLTVRNVCNWDQNTNQSMARMWHVELPVGNCKAVRVFGDVSVHRNTRAVGHHNLFPTKGNAPRSPHIQREELC